MTDARTRLTEAIEGERRHWFRVEVLPDDIAAVLAASRAATEPGLPDAVREGLQTAEAELEHEDGRDCGDPNCPVTAIRYVLATEPGAFIEVDFNNLDNEAHIHLATERWVRDGDEIVRLRALVVDWESQQGLATPDAGDKAEAPRCSVCGVPIAEHPDTDACALIDEAGIR